MAESVIMVVLFITMLFIEAFRTDPRALLHKPTDESPFFIGMFKSEPEEGDKDFSPVKTKKGLKVKDSGTKGKQLDQGISYWEITDKKIRHTQLANIVNTVKSLADLNLNNKLDELIDCQVEGL